MYYQHETINILILIGHHNNLQHTIFQYIQFNVLLQTLHVDPDCIIFRKCCHPQDKIIQ